MDSAGGNSASAAAGNHQQQSSIFNDDLVSRELKTAAGKIYYYSQKTESLFSNAFFYPRSGDLGKELKNLITLMDKEEAEENERTLRQRRREN